MDIIQFIAQFFYRIRYWLLWGGFIVTALVAYFTQFLPFSYTVNSNIYAGVTNVTNIDGSKIENISSTFDNLINIAKVQKHIGEGLSPLACHEPCIWRGVAG